MGRDVSEPEKISLADFAKAIRKFRQFRLEILRCKKCRCNWPKKELTGEGLCPNCATVRRT